MNILLDATVMQQPATGVAKATLGLYAACLKQRPDLLVTAVHRRPLRCDLPSHMSDRLCGAYLPRAAWRELFLPFHVALNPASFIHFPWNGNVPRGLGKVGVVTTLNDVLPLAIPSYFKSEREETAYRAKVQQDLDRTDILVTISEYSKKEILDNFKVKSDPVVIPLGPTLATDRAPSSEPPSESYFMYLGGYDARKGIEKLLTVFSEMHRNNLLRSKLVLTGSKNYYSQALKDLIQDGVQQGYLIEKGYVEDQQLIDLLAKATALIYPSKFEGFGLPPLEAMALGCPVVTTRCTAIPEVCGDAVVYVDPDEPRQFAQQIDRLQEDKELLSELKAKGLQQAARFSWDNSARKFIESLEKSRHGK